MPVPGGRPTGTDLQKKGSHDRCLQLRLGGTVAMADWCLDPGPAWSSACISLPGKDGGFSGPQNLPSSPKRAPYPPLFGQHDYGSLYNSPGQSQAMDPLQNGEVPPLVSTLKGVVLKRQCTLNQRVHMWSWGNLSPLHGDLWGGRCRPFHL